MMGMMLVAMLIVFLTMPYHSYSNRRFPITFRKFGNVAVFSAMMTCGIYVLVYGKTLDWFADSSIVRSVALTVFFAAVFIYMEWSNRSPYFRMGVFRLRSINMGIVLFLLLMVFNTSSMFVNVFTGIGMEIDNWQNAALGNWSILGYFIGAVIAIVLGSKGVKLKYLFGIGFFLIGMSALFMYFEVQTAGLYERMKYPVIIRSTGMMLIYSLTAVYANQRMPFKYLSTWICIMLSVRMVIGPGIGSALYSNVLQYRQQHYVTVFAKDIDRVDTQAAATYEAKPKLKIWLLCRLRARYRCRQLCRQLRKCRAGHSTAVCFPCSLCSFIHIRRGNYRLGVTECPPSQIILLL